MWCINVIAKYRGAEYSRDWMHEESDQLQWNGRANHMVLFLQWESHSQYTNKFYSSKNEKLQPLKCTQIWKIQMSSTSYCWAEETELHVMEYTACMEKYMLYFKLNSNSNEYTYSEHWTYAEKNKRNFKNDLYLLLPTL